MLHTLKTLNITEAQLEVLRNSKPYGHAYFDVERSSWIIDFYATKSGEDSMYVKFIKEMMSKPSVTVINLFELYMDDMFLYAFVGVNGEYLHGYVQLRPIIKKTETSI